MEAGDDAEIVGAAVQGEEEVVVGGGGGGYDKPGCEDDFVREDGIAGEAGEAGEECYASCFIQSRKS